MCPAVRVLFLAAQQRTSQAGSARPSPLIEVITHAVCMCVCVCVFVIWYMLHNEHKNSHLSSRVRAFCLVLATSKLCLRVHTWIGSGLNLDWVRNRVRSWGGAGLCPCEHSQRQRCVYTFIHCMFMCVCSCKHVSVPRWWHRRNHGSLPRDPEEQGTAVPQSLVLAGARRERKDWPGTRAPVRPAGPHWDTGIPGNWPAGAPEGSKSLWWGGTDKPERMLTILILILTSQTHAWDVFSLQLEVSRKTWYLMNKAWLCPLIICTGHTVLHQTGLDHANKAGHCQPHTHVSQHFTALTEASREAFYLLTRVRIVCLQSQQDSISESGGGQTRSPLCDDWCRDFLLCWLWGKCTSTHFTGHLAQLKRKELSSG